MGNKGDIGWKRQTSEDDRIRVKAKKVGNRWLFHIRDKRFDSWQDYAEPELADWLELLDAVRRRIQRDLIPEIEEMLGWQSKSISEWNSFNSAFGVLNQRSTNLHGSKEAEIVFGRLTSTGPYISTLPEEYQDVAKLANTILGTKNAVRLSEFIRGVDQATGRVGELSEDNLLLGLIDPEYFYTEQFRVSQFIPSLFSANYARSENSGNTIQE